MKRDIWMPLNVGDYLADTGHLSTTEHGAYLLLLMHYWRKRELPTEDRQLAAIAKLQIRIWLEIKPTIQSFFHDGWRHKRVEAEITKRAEVSEKRAAAGSKGGSRKQANASFCSSMTQSQEPKEDRIGEARTGASSFTDGSKALVGVLWKALGYKTALEIPPDLAGADWRAIEWEKSGWTADLIEAQARKIGPGKPLNYYEKVFATEFAKRQAPLPTVQIREAETLEIQCHGRGSQVRQAANLSAVARRLAEEGVSFGERPAAPSLRSIPSGADVRLLPQGGGE